MAVGRPLPSVDSAPSPTAVTSPKSLNSMGRHYRGELFRYTLLNVCDLFVIADTDGDRASKGENVRKLSMILGVGFLVGVMAAPALATRTVVSVEGRLTDPYVFGLPADEVVMAPGDQPGFNWTSDGIWHVRNVPVTETISSLDGSTEVGHIERTFNFNLDMATGSSRAWCAFTITLTDPDLGAFDGRCGGSLVNGTIVGNGPGSHLMGTYSLEAGGVPGVGPYVIELEISRG